MLYKFRKNPELYKSIRLFISQETKRAGIPQGRLIAVANLFSEDTIGTCYAMRKWYEIIASISERMPQHCQGQWKSVVDNMFQNIEPCYIYRTVGSNFEK